MESGVENRGPGWIAINTSGAGNAAFQVREFNGGGAQTGAHVEAPGIAFHWSGRIINHLFMDASGHFRFVNWGMDGGLATIWVGAINNYVIAGDASWPGLSQIIINSSNNWTYINNLQLASGEWNPPIAHVACFTANNTGMAKCSFAHLQNSIAGNISRFYNDQGYMSIYYNGNCGELRSPKLIVSNRAAPGDLANLGDGDVAMYSRGGSIVFASKIGGTVWYRYFVMNNSNPISAGSTTPV